MRRGIEVRVHRSRRTEGIDIGDQMTADPISVDEVSDSGFFIGIAHGNGGMQQPFHCATPAEAAQTHRLFTAALQSQRDATTVTVS